MKSLFFALLLGMGCVHSMDIAPFAVINSLISGISEINSGYVDPPLEFQCIEEKGLNVPHLLKINIDNFDHSFLCKKLIKILEILKETSVHFGAFIQSNRGLEFLSSLTSIDKLYIYLDEKCSLPLFDEKCSYPFLKNLEIRGEGGSNWGEMKPKNFSSLETVVVPFSDFNQSSLLFFSEIKSLKKVTYFSKQIQEDSLKYITSLFDSLDLKDKETLSWESTFYGVVIKKNK